MNTIGNIVKEKLQNYEEKLKASNRRSLSRICNCTEGAFLLAMTIYVVGNMNAWIQTITYRKAISFLRKETGKYELSFDDIEDFIFEPVQSPAEEMISKEEMAKINDAIQQLPPKCKHVFFLAKIDGLPYKDIADMLNISVKTINNHIAFALDEIAKRLNMKSRKS